MLPPDFDAKLREAMRGAGVGMQQLADRIMRFSSQLDADRVSTIEAIRKLSEAMRRDDVSRGN